jgi:hypothetical protein
MKCPRSQDWNLLAMDALEDEQAAALRAHACECPACREVYAAARREHVDRMRMYEAFDRDHDVLREQLLAALPAEAPRRSALDPLARGWYRLGDYTMSLTKTTGRRTAALLVPTAAVLLIALFLVLPSPKSAYAAALEHLRQARSFVCRLSIPDGLEVQGVPIRAEGTLQFSDEFGSHCEMRMNDLVVSQQFAPVQGPMTIVQPATRTWMVLDPNRLALIELSAQSPSAFVSALRKLTDDGATELTQEIIDGRAALGYRVPGEKLGIPAPRKAGTEPAYAEVWVNVQTRLPAKLVVSLPLPDEGKRLKIVFDRFEWNVPLEPGLFEPNIPPDYVQVDTQLALPSEDALLSALRRIAYWTGRYPATLGPGSVLGRLHTMIAEGRRAEFDELGRAGIMRLGIEIGGGTMYYMKLVRDGREPEYFGDEVTPADSDKVLLRWQLDDGQVRAVYGDLHAETLPSEK